MGQIPVSPFDVHLTGAWWGNFSAPYSLYLNFDVVIFDHNLVIVHTLRSGWAQDVPCFEIVLCPMPWTCDRHFLDLAFG